MQAIEIGLGLVALPVGDQPRKRALAARGQRDQSLAEAGKPTERNVRLFLDRAIEVRRRHELAQVGIAKVVFRQQDQPVDPAFAADFRRPGNPQHRADDRLHALGEAGIAERHCAVEPVAVGQADRGEAELRRTLGDRLGLHRPFEHGERREIAKRDVGLIYDRKYEDRGRPWEALAGDLSTLIWPATNGLP